MMHGCNSSAVSCQPYRVNELMKGGQHQISAGGFNIHRHCVDALDDNEHKALRHHADLKGLKLFLVLGIVVVCRPV